MIVMQRAEMVIRARRTQQASADAHLEVTK